MIDAAYQSVICFFMPYLLFRPAQFVTHQGQTVGDFREFGVYVANAAVIVVNTYVLMNTYRWDWFMVLITSISILLIFFWTGVYSSFTAGFTFYGAAKNCYGQLSFWCLTLLTCIICLTPRFAIKSFQKIFMPRDVDIIREQVKQGKFDYLNDVDPEHAMPLALHHGEKDLESASSSELSKPTDSARQTKHTRHRGADDDQRPFYPPSMTNTNTTYHGYSPQGSDGTADLNSLRASLDRAYPPTSRQDSDMLRCARPPAVSPIESEYSSRYSPRLSQERSRPPMESEYSSRYSPRISLDRPRPSFDRLRNSLERSRTNYSLASLDDFTSAANLARVESSQGPSNLSKNVYTVER